MITVYVQVKSLENTFYLMFMMEPIKAHILRSRKHVCLADMLNHQIRATVQAYEILSLYIQL